MPVNDFSTFPMSWRPARADLGEGPVYLGLAAALEGEIVAGRLPPGTRLPPQRELADYLDLNFTTVTRAYDLCREKRLVYGVTGRGTFVSAMPGVTDGAEGPRADFGVVQGFPSVGADEVVAAAQAVLAREGAAGLFSYRDRDGRGRTREAGRLWLRGRGIDVPAGRIAVFPGVQSVLSAALFSLFRVGDALAVDPFTYGNLIGLARLARIRLVAIPSDAEGMRPDALDEAVVRRRVRGVFLMPSCANPTALTLGADRRTELARVARARDLLVLEDDAHLGLDPAGALFSRVPERTVYLAGTSRLVAAGLRATYAAFPERVREPLLAGLHHTAIKASALEAEILGELILGGAAETLLARKRQAATRANAAFDRVFGIRPRRDDVRLFRTVPLPGTAGRGPEVERALAAKGLGVFHSDRFRVGKAASDPFLRISVSNARSEPTFVSDLERLKESLSGG